MAKEDGETPQNDLFDLWQEVIAPIHRRAQGLLARQGGTPTTGQQVETVRQPLSEARDPERFYLDRRELQSQRHSVETAANLQQLGNMGVAKDETVDRRHSPIVEQLNGRIAQRFGSAQTSCSRRNPKGREAQQPFALCS